MKVIHTGLPILAMTVGSRVVTGKWFPRFTEEEQAAIIAHEEGHIYHKHALVRIWWLVTVRWKHLLYRCKLQEFEADAYAVIQGHAEGLIKFLHKVHMPEGPLHPASSDRLENILRLTESMKPQTLRHP
jgi:Zn-dependent protease with chaperone function